MPGRRHGAHGRVADRRCHPGRRHGDCFRRRGPAGADITIATIDFLARGGDRYPYGGLPFTNVGVSYQLTVCNYLTGDPRSGALEGTVTAAAYTEGGDERISDVTP